MRSKEDAQDYRYFPDPDLVPIHISDEYLAELKAKQPEFKDEKKARYIEEFGLPEYDAEILQILRSSQKSLRKPQQSATSQRRFLTGLWVRQCDS